MDIMDILPPSAAPTSSSPWTVSEVSRRLKTLVEGSFASIQVQGEISGFKLHTSGHRYFALKDQEAVLDGVCWRGTTLDVTPADGLEVVCHGRLTTYPGRSKYQMVVTRMTLAGQGALLKLLEDRKRALAAEGLFDNDKKRPLPTFPERIGLITSLTGAVIRDVLHRLEERFPVDVMVWPVSVQGETARTEIITALDGISRWAQRAPHDAPQVVILARGGGSLEDLWTFNEDDVVRAVARCAIPIVTAVGHETDTTLVDYASDKRAPTPTAAAEFVVPERQTLHHQLNTLHRRLILLGEHQLLRHTSQLTHLTQRLAHQDNFWAPLQQLVDDLQMRQSQSVEWRFERLSRQLEVFQTRLASLRPENIVTAWHEKLHQLQKRQTYALDVFFKQRQEKLTLWQALLAGLSYQNTLKRGFAMVMTETGTLIKAAHALTPGQTVALHFHDGEAKAKAL